MTRKFTSISLSTKILGAIHHEDPAYLKETFGKAMAIRILNCVSEQKRTGPLLTKKEDIDADAWTNQEAEEEKNFNIRMKKEDKDDDQKDGDRWPTSDQLGVNLGEQDYPPRQLSKDDMKFVYDTINKDKNVADKQPDDFRNAADFKAYYSGLTHEEVVSKEWVCSLDDKKFNSYDAFLKHLASEHLNTAHKDDPDLKEGFRYDIKRQNGGILITRKKDKKSVFLQGDDASAFEDELDKTNDSWDDDDAASEYDNVMESTYLDDLKKSNPALAADYAIVGGQSSAALANMVRALSMMPRMNTAEENERLAAAKRILKARKGR